jgi:hypothetical protein
MYNNYISDNQYRYYGSGSRSSDQVPVCFTCRNRGWPHELIVLAKARSGGYLKLDYITGEPHIHKDRKGGVKVQPKSEPVVDPDQKRFNEVIEKLISALDKLTPEAEASKK